MFDWLVEVFREYPYLGVSAVFLACGLGLPLPEEIVLVSAGYICYLNERVELWSMMLVCAAAILAGDAIPFMLGRVFGPGLLKSAPPGPVQSTSCVKPPPPPEVPFRFNERFAASKT